MSIPRPVKLRCEYLERPQGVDTHLPCFSWQLNHPERGLAQEAYQVLVSADWDEIQAEIGSVCDSGRIESEATVNVAYNGTRLRSSTRYYWRVRWWDNNGSESPYSEVSFFVTGFLMSEDWKAEWITMKKPASFTSAINRLLNGIDRNSRQYHAIYLRKTFKIKKNVQNSFVHVSGLGYYELSLNGRKVGDHLLDPGQTDYDHIALYSTFDVTQLLKPGENTLGLILGNGRHIEAYGFSEPKGIVQLLVEYENGEKETVITDEQWEASPGPIMENGIYYGERYDARMEMPGWDNADFDNSAWEQVKTVQGPPLVSQLMPPIRSTQILKPETLFRPKPGVFIYDFGQNFSGWARLKVKGPAGTEVRLRFSELLDENRMLNISALGGIEATDVYILKGEGEEFFEPRFTYHGFRYVELTGFPGVPAIENMEGVFLHTDVEKTGDFHCSNQLLNTLHQNIYWGQLSNLMSVPTDCPQRGERMGWMGDIQLVAEEAFYNFQMAPFFLKYLNDIRVAQKEDGSLSDVIPPYWSIYPADPAWGSAYITIGWYCYLFTGGTRILEEHFETMKRYVNFMQESSDGLIIKTLGKYGDWCPPGSILPKNTPVELTSTWYFYHDTLLLSRIAEAIGREDECKELNHRAREIKKAFNGEFLDNGRYATVTNGQLTRAFLSQTSQALPLYLDMVPEDQKDRALRLLKRAVVVQSDSHLDTGIVGTRYIFDVLTENNEGETAFKVATQKTFPSWGYMIEEGATTLWERWEKLEGGGMNSHNHIMLGSIDAWFYRTIAGIVPLEPGWKKVGIRPHLLGDLTDASAALKTVRGEIAVSWEKLGDRVRLVISIPVNISAEVCVPAFGEMTRIKESGTTIWPVEEGADSVPGIIPVEAEQDFVRFKVSSGFYEFEAFKN